MIQKIVVETLKKRYTHLDFRTELAHSLVAGFSGRKRKGAEAYAISSIHFLKIFQELC
jgi:hypothetical protein